MTVVAQQLHRTTHLCPLTPLRVLGDDELGRWRLVVVVAHGEIGMLGRVVGGLGLGGAVGLGRVLVLFWVDGEFDF